MIRYPKARDIKPGLVYHEFQVEFRRLTCELMGCNFYPNSETYQRYYGGYCLYHKQQKAKLEANIVH